MLPDDVLTVTEFADWSIFLMVKTFPAEGDGKYTLMIPEDASHNKTASDDDRFSVALLVILTAILNPLSVASLNSGL